jgi:DNA-binding LytR/AlgR family response regulator
VVPGLFTFFVIAAFAPLGFSELTLMLRIVYALVFAALTNLVVFLLVILLRVIFPVWMNEDRWTIGKELALFGVVLFGICLFYFTGFLMLELTDIPFLLLFKKVVFHTLLISFIPILAVVIAEQLYHQKQKLTQAKRISDTLRKRAHSSPINSNENAAHQDIVISLTAENGSIELEIRPEKLLFLKSDGNYVEVIYLTQEQELHKTLIRNRLKMLGAQLPASLFYRCHKSYIVNLSHIHHVEGNARNLELHLTVADAIIPVSRSKSDQITQFLSR